MISTQWKLGILATLLLILGSNLLGEDTIKLWYGGPGSSAANGVVNLPSYAKNLASSKTANGNAYRLGYRIPTCDNGLTINAPSCMKDCVAVTIQSGIPVGTRILANGSMKFSREDLLLLRAQSISSFFVRIHDIEGDFVMIKVVLNETRDSFEVLVR